MRCVLLKMPTAVAGRDSSARRPASPSTANADSSCRPGFVRETSGIPKHGVVTSYAELSEPCKSATGPAPGPAMAGNLQSAGGTRTVDRRAAPPHSGSLRESGVRSPHRNAHPSGLPGEHEVHQVVGAAVGSEGEPLDRRGAALAPYDRPPELFRPHPLGVDWKSTRLN